MTGSVLLKVTDLTKSFGGVMAVSDISFDLKEGELLGVIGPNGSGKTTLVNLITGFVKPVSGTIFYKGTNITGKAPLQDRGSGHLPDIPDGQTLLSAPGL